MLFNYTDRVSVFIHRLTCIADPTIIACAMHLLDRSALQDPEIKLVQCMVSSEMHCRIRKTSLCNAWNRRKCIAEYGNQACAMHLPDRSALQDPEIKLVQCICSAGVHCRTRKSSLCNASARQTCIAPPTNPASAMHT